MTHAPKFWADKLPANQRPIFWSFVNGLDGMRGFDGETAYCRTLDFFNLTKNPEDWPHEQT